MSSTTFNSSWSIVQIHLIVPSFKVRCTLLTQSHILFTMSDTYGSNTWRSLWAHAVPTLSVSQSEYWQRRIARHGTTSVVIDAVTPLYNTYKVTAYNDMLNAQDRYNHRLESRHQSFNDHCHSTSEYSFYVTRTGGIFPEYHAQLIGLAIDMARATKRLKIRSCLSICKQR